MKFGKKTRKNIALCLLALIGLSSCATMSEEECAVSDWAAVGYEDGARGVTGDYFGEYRRDCADFGIAPDFQAWQAGRNEGLVEYCQPSRGFYLGENGGRYNGVCNANLEPAFLDAYLVGEQLYSMRADVVNLTSRLNRNEQLLNRIEEDIAGTEALLVADGTSTETRLVLLAEVKQLAERMGELEEEVRLLIDQRARADQDLQDFEASIIGSGF